MLAILKPACCVAKSGHIDLVAKGVQQRLVQQAGSVEARQQGDMGTVQGARSQRVARRSSAGRSPPHALRTGLSEEERGKGDLRAEEETLKYRGLRGVIGPREAQPLPEEVHPIRPRGRCCALRVKRGADTIPAS